MYCLGGGSGRPPAPPPQGRSQRVTAAPGVMRSSSLRPVLPSRCAHSHAGSVGPISTWVELGLGSGSGREWDGGGVESEGRIPRLRVWLRGLAQGRLAPDFEMAASTRHAARKGAAPPQPQLQPLPQPWSPSALPPPSVPPPPAASLLLIQCSTARSFTSPGMVRGCTGVYGSVQEGTGGYACVVKRRKMCSTASGWLGLTLWCKKSWQLRAATRAAW